MRRSPDEVTETELAMLQVLWDRGTATRRQVTDALYPDGDAAHYATVQKLLGRLEDKGFVRHTRDAQGVLVFTATVGRDQFIGLHLRDVAARLCGGSLTPLLMNLVRARPLSERELNELEAFLDEQRRQNRSRGKPR
jgi:BlaI family penicillinase repressor